MMTTNVVESWNVVLVKAREFPLICMLEFIRSTIMGWFSTRRAKATADKCSVTTRVRAMLEENFENSAS